MSDVGTNLTLSEVARRLDSVGITWAVFAGAAAAVYGVTRPLTDVDILIPAAEGERVVGLFPEAQVKRREDGTVHILRLPDFDLVAGLMWREGGVDHPVDLDAEMAARLTRHEIAGVAVPVIPPEDNILIKAVWGRGPEVGKHDLEDVREMVDHLPALNWEYLHWRAGVFGTGQRVQQALDYLDVLRRAEDAA
jgi:hypothetical protein